MTRPLVLNFDLPQQTTRHTASEDKQTQAGLPFVPPTADVVIRDEYQAQNFLFADDWRTPGPIGYVRAPVQDVRT